ncbi:MAG: polysaccharide deacetylase family protein [Hyphomonadaceae bacterium]|nr:polysaccharide deacetylase family protein [Hyphomonadaceae bacterium]
MCKLAARVPILMFHSISDAGGPTSIAPDTFKSMMSSLAASDYNVVSLQDVAAWHKGERDLPAKAMAITFDDGFVDFKEHAHPVLEQFKFPSTLFVPTRKTGGEEDWYGGHDATRPLLDWPDLKMLDQARVDIAPHGRNHVDLSSLGADELRAEVSGSKEDLESELNKVTSHFAPPYGQVNAAALAQIAEHYDLSVGVEHGIATRNSDIHDLPRLEMFYYQDPKRWQDFLDGKGETYLTLRRALRRLRQWIRPTAYS